MINTSGQGLAGLAYGFGGACCQPLINNVNGRWIRQVDRDVDEVVEACAVASGRSELKQLLCMTERPKLHRHWVLESGVQICSTQHVSVCIHAQELHANKNVRAGLN